MTALVLAASIAAETASIETAPAAPAVRAVRDFLRPAAPAVDGAPLPLEAAVSTALERNVPLLRGRVAPRTARASLETARAGFDPTVTLSGDQDWARTAGTSSLAGGNLVERRTTTLSAGLAQTLPFGTVYEVTVTDVRNRTSNAFTTLNPSHAADVAVSVTQPLLEGRGRTAAYAPVLEAERSLSAAERRSARLAREVAAEVEAAYWMLAEAEENERTARESLALAEALRNRNESLLTEGLLAEVEVLTARAGVAARREALVAAETARADAAEALLFAVEGERARDAARLPRTVTPPPDVPEPPPLETIEAEAVAARDDVVAARAEVEAAEIALGAARNALLPDLALTGSIGTGGTAGKFGDAFENLSENQEPAWSAGLVLTIPLGSRADRAAHEAALAALDERRLALAEVEIGVRRAVREARRAVVMGLERLAAAEVSRELAERRLEAEERRLEFGLGDTIRVLEAEEDAAQARLAEARARFGLAAARARLEAAAGGAFPTGAARAEAGR